MNAPRQSIRWFAIVAIALSTRQSIADEIGGFEILLHEFCGEASANVFDGGEVVTDSFCNLGPPPDTFGGDIDAFDLTQPGSLGAIASVTGGSSADIQSGGTIMRIDIDLLTAYLPSGFPGGDNPGGFAEGEFTSIIEFEMPYDDLPWTYENHIEADAPFEGSTYILMENVTQGTTLLEVTRELPDFEGTLYGNAGDVIRFTSMLEGAGMMGPGSHKMYEPRFKTVFWVPEPSSLALLLIASLLLMRASNPLSRART